MKNISLPLPAALFLILFLMPHPVHAAAGDTLRITGPNVNVRERPDITSPVILKVRKDTVVAERSRQGDWVFVEVPGSGRQGWINATLLITVKPMPAKGDASSSPPVTALESSPQNEGRPMTTAAGSPLPKPPVTKVGVVDLQRIIDESVEGKKTKKHFAELAASTPAVDLNQIEEQLVRQVIKRIETIIADYARKEGFTHVVDAPKAGFVFADERFDITDPIIKRYDEKSAAEAAERPRTEKPADSELPRPPGAGSR